MNIKELSKKEVKEILDKIKKEYNIDISDLDFLYRDFLWFINKEGKVYIIRKELKNFLNIKYIQKFGLYILKIEKDGIRFSIEGSQIFGPFSTKFIKIDKKRWIKGEDIKVNIGYIPGFVIVKDNNDFLGCSKIKNFVARNFIPKNRRLHT